MKNSAEFFNLSTSERDFEIFHHTPYIKKLWAIFLFTVVFNIVSMYALSSSAFPKILIATNQSKICIFQKKKTRNFSVSAPQFLMTPRYKLYVVISTLIWKKIARAPGGHKRCKLTKLGGSEQNRYKNNNACFWKREQLESVTQSSWLTEETQLHLIYLVSSNRFM